MSYSTSEKLNTDITRTLNALRSVAEEDEEDCFIKFSETREDENAAVMSLNVLLRVMGRGGARRDRRMPMVLETPRW